MSLQPVTTNSRDPYVLDELPKSLVNSMIKEAVAKKLAKEFPEMSETYGDERYHEPWKEEPMSCCESKPVTERSIYRGIVYDRNADEIVVDDTYICVNYRQVEVLLGIDLHEYAKEQSITYDLADYDFVIQHIGDVRPKSK